MRVGVLAAAEVAADRGGVGGGDVHYFLLHAMSNEILCLALGVANNQYP